MNKLYILLLLLLLPLMACSLSNVAPMPEATTPTAVTTPTLNPTLVNTETPVVAVITNLPATNTVMPTLEATAVLPTLPPSTNTPLPPPTPVPSSSWFPSIISGELDENYPLTAVTNTGNITLHYQPGTYAEWNLSSLSATIDQIWFDIQNQLGGQVGRPIDVYLGGTLFAINPGLQGYTQSGLFRTFILINGAFHPGEMEYILAHELTHIATTHILGTPVSTMLHEGIATYLPQRYLTGTAAYLPLSTICASILSNSPTTGTTTNNDFASATEMAEFSYTPTGFSGHIRTFFHYNLSGCFVAYLIETYGLENFAQVYRTGSYGAVYGRSLAELDQEWQDSLSQISLPPDSSRFVTMVGNVTQAYETYLEASAEGVHANWNAYLHLNQARLATNQGHLNEAQTQLDLFWSLLEQ